jgi:hypothetical protein
LIKETLNADQKVAVTSDRWHVVHARWSGVPGTPRFIRTIVSEHEDDVSAMRAARELRSSLVDGMSQRPRETHDQVIVRQPNAESLKDAKRFVRRPK